MNPKYTAKKTADNNYEIQDEKGVKISTGTKDILQNYGLSEGNLGGLATTSGLNPPSPAPVIPTTPVKETLPGIGTLTRTPKTPVGTGGIPVTDPNANLTDNTPGLYERTGVTPPPAYTVKQGDTLSDIAVKNGMSLSQLLALNPDIKDPNKIGIGQSINTGGGVKKVSDGSTLSSTGLPPGWDQVSYDHFKAANPGLEPTAADLVKFKGLPTYPNSQTGSTQSSIMDSYNALLASITTIEDKIKSNSTPSQEEQDLQKELASKKDQLKGFDLNLETRVNNLYGQGRGATIGNIQTNETIQRRTSALERLGLAQEADTLTTQLGLAQDQRKAQGDLATTEYNLATKKLDIALGIQKEIQSLNEKDKDNARQYLLDVVTFSSGKAYSELDPATQTAITNAVANSPITLDMVKTALQSAKEKAAASANGNLRSVPGVGVVQIADDGKSYKVVVPEKVTNPVNDTTPTFDQYVTDQKIPLPSLTPEKIKALHDEYDAKYGGATVDLGKLTPTNISDLSQAGLTSAPSAVQSYFLNTPTEFRDQYQRDSAAGKNTKNPTLTDITGAYTTWYNAQKKSGSHDWSALLGGTPAK